MGLLPDLLTGLRGLTGLGSREALAAAFPGLRYVQVLRRDKVAQAVSLWTAVQTAEWRDDGDARGRHEPRYRFRAIEHLVAQLEADERAWTEWLVAARIEPVSVVYEELAQAPREVAARVLAALGLEPAEAPRATMQRQAGARSLEWADRYFREAAAQAVA